MLLRRHILFLSLLPLLAACAMEKDSKPMPPQPAPPAPIAQLAPAPDLMNAMDRPSVEVYPLNGPVADPFTRKNLQPLSQKVLAEGYPVMDPSVTVYPLSMPTAMPNVTMDNVRADAQSALYTGRVRSQAMQNSNKMQPIYDDGSPAPIMSSDAGMVDVQTEALPPIMPPPADSPSIWGDVPTAYLPPLPDMPAYTPPSQPAYAPTQTGQRVAPVDTSYGGSGATITSGLPAPSSVNPATVNDEMPNTNAVMPSLTGY